MNKLFDSIDDYTNIALDIYNKQSNPIFEVTSKYLDVYIDDVYIKDVNKISFKNISRLIIETGTSYHIKTANIYFFVNKNDIILNGEDLKVNINNKNNNIHCVKVIYSSLSELVFKSPYKNIIKLLNKNILDIIIDYEHSIIYDYNNISKCDYGNLSLSDADVKKSNINNNVSDYSYNKYYF